MKTLCKVICWAALVAVCPTMLLTWMLTDDDE